MIVSIYRAHINYNVGNNQMSVIQEGSLEEITSYLTNGFPNIVDPGEPVALNSVCMIFLKLELR